MQIIDLRSDTVTKPSAEMRKFMCEAEVGDDVYKEDPTVNRLEKMTAEILGKEAALFVPSGVMGNQICLKVLTNPGDEVICDKDAHIFHYESGSAAALSGIQLYPVNGINGIFCPEMIEPLIRPESAYYMPRTKVIEVENTHNRAGGMINPIENIASLRKLAYKHNLYCHLDGARIWNASIKTGINPAEYAKYFDTVSVCFSKGLGAPVGSAIAGSKDIIKEAFRIRKGWGGGMRQVGILAAAAIFALENNRPLLKLDHEKAEILAKKINTLPGLKIIPENVQTNILMFSPLNDSVENSIKKCSDKGLLLSAGNINTIRAVTHLNISFDQITAACRILEEVFS